MHGAMGGGTNGAGHVNMGLPYKAYKAEQVSVMQVMVVGVHTEIAGYEQVGMLMQGTAGAIEAAGMGPVMHLAIGGGNIRLPSVAPPAEGARVPPGGRNSNNQETNHSPPRKFFKKDLQIPSSVF